MRYAEPKTEKQEMDLVQALVGRKVRTADGQMVKITGLDRDEDYGTTIVLLENQTWMHLPEVQEVI